MASNKNICKGCGQICHLKSEIDSHNLTCVFFNQALYRKLREQSQNMTSHSEVLDYLKNDFFKTVILYYDAKFDKLYEENTKLKKDVQSLKNALNMRTKKKIIDILNHSKYQSPTFHEWVDSFQISAEHLESVFENDLLEGMKNVISAVIPDRFSVPIRAFTEKKGFLYVFVYNKETKNKEWKTVENDEINKMIYTLSRRFIKRFLEWSKENEEKNNSDEKLMEDHITYMMKINGGQKSDEKMMNEIKEWLFQKLHTNIDYIV